MTREEFEHSWTLALLEADYTEEDMRCGRYTMPFAQVRAYVNQLEARDVPMRIVSSEEYASLPGRVVDTYLGIVSHCSHIAMHYDVDAEGCCKKLLEICLVQELENKKIMRISDADFQTAIDCLEAETHGYSAVEVVVAYAEQLKNKIPRWRSVEKDGLPEKSGPCFIYSPRWQSVGVHCLEDAAVSNWNAKSGRWEEPFDVVWLPSEVTHYLPLSDLPEPIEEA